MSVSIPSPSSMMVLPRPGVPCPLDFSQYPPIEGMGATGGFQRSLPQVGAHDATDADCPARPLKLLPGRAAGPTLSSAVALPPEHGAAFTPVWNRSFSILFPGLTIAPTLPSAAAQPHESGAAVPLAIISCAICLGLLVVEVVLGEPIDEVDMAMVLDEHKVAWTTGAA